MKALTELIARLKAETPKFFRILSLIALIFLAIMELGVLDLVQMPDKLSTSLKIAAIVASMISSFAVSTPEATQNVLKKGSEN